MGEGAVRSATLAHLEGEKWNRQEVAKVTRCGGFLKI